MGVPQRVAVDPRAARLAAAGRRRLAGGRGHRAPSLRPRDAPERMGAAAGRHSRRLLALGRIVDQRVRGRVHDRRARAARQHRSVHVPLQPSDRRPREGGAVGGGLGDERVAQDAARGPRVGRRDRRVVRHGRCARWSRSRSPPRARSRSIASRASSTAARSSTPTRSRRRCRVASSTRSTPRSGARRRSPRASANQLNFNTNRVLRLNEMPQVDVQLVGSTNPPSGVGEPGVPPLAPALAERVCPAHRRPQRSLPFFPGSTMGGL